MRPALGRKSDVSSRAMSDTKLNTEQHSSPTAPGAGLSVELLADFGDDSAPSKKVVLKTTCRQTLGSKQRFALILPSTVAPHALRHRLPHSDVDALQIKCG